MVPAGWLSGFPLSSDPWSSVGTSCTGNQVYLDPQREVEYLTDSLQQAWKKEWECKKKKQAIAPREKLGKKRCVLGSTQHVHHLHTRGLALWKWKQLSAARTGNPRVSLQSLTTINMSEKHSVIVYCLCCTVYCWNELLPKFIQIYSNQI